MKPIWYFVGLLLLIMGCIILGAGIYELFVPPAEQKVLADYHPSLWWGALLIVGGIIFVVTQRNKVVSHDEHE